jgi:NCS1 family nucleobase:cation symporter-1
VNAVSGLEAPIVWRRFFQISFFFGYIVSGSLFYVFNKLSPPPGLGVQVDFQTDGTALVIEGVVGKDSKEHGEYNKEMASVESKSEGSV